MDAMKYEAVVFDWDGTLWDSWRAHEAALRFAASRAGRPPPSSEAIAACLGLPLDWIFTTLFQETPSGMMDGYLDHYSRHWRATTQLFPETLSMLRGLEQRGYRLALLSNKPRNAGTAELAEAGLEGVFAAAAFGDEVTRPKPAPDGLHRLLKGLGTPPTRALYVGDTFADQECASRAGTGFAAAAWGRLAPSLRPLAQPVTAWKRPADALAEL